MSSSTIDIQLNIQCLARQSTFTSHSSYDVSIVQNQNLSNIELDNRHSAQHSSFRRLSPASFVLRLKRVVDSRLLEQMFLGANSIQRRKQKIKRTKTATDQDLETVEEIWKPQKKNFFFSINPANRNVKINGNYKL